ncbi:type II secretion system protein GspM [Natronospira bacteriovora]|uniref:Type II secretion system protein GspM n=1 Tax=Natronospira bacteriovora TaxID=3069753 RepID=A0ABU0W789_9GAMM|nr:type II secretion system protein GspM [Natronospira sp. AB-CW4]MDQ2069874.1 type II secretion system protein GspM [Natronospira sp. AB-CW4]
MKDRLYQVRDRIDALSLRERVLIFMAAAAVLAFLWNAVFMEPLNQRRELAQERVGDLRDRIHQTNDSIATIIRAREGDPDARNRERLAALQDELSALDGRLAALTGDLIEPTRMAVMLERILERQQGLELISLRSLEPRPLLRDEEMEGLGNIYRHGVRMELRGEYRDVVRYLKALEALDANLYWGSLQLDMESWPRNRVVLVVHSLSLREDWIGV